MTNVYDPRIHYRTAGGWIDVGTGAFTPVAFPTATTVGVAGLGGWTPAHTVGSVEAPELVQFGEPGGILEDTRIYGALMITGPHITVRRCEIIGGVINNAYGNQIGNDLLVEDTTIKLDPPGVSTEFVGGVSAIGDSSMTVRRTAILDHIEGFRLGGSIYALRDPTPPTIGYLTRMYNCFVRIQGPTPCSPIQGDEYHGDGMQAFDEGMAGVGLTVRNSVIFSIDQHTTDQVGDEPVPKCGGTSCMICGTTQAKPFNIDGLVMAGAGYSFQCNNGGIFKNLYFVDDSWVYGCLSLDRWDLVDEDNWAAWTCTLDGAGQPTTLINSVPFGYNGTDPLLDPP